MPRTRNGITLTEVLVSIFVCGLGLMALMTLFPLGALNMAQAIKDDRCGHCAYNAAAILRAMWRVSLESGAMDANLETALAQGPVYVDPLGMNMFGGRPLPGGIPRMNLNNANYPQALRWCSLLDDIDFNPNATPVPLAGEISRQGRYSWAWMVRWLKDAAPNRRARALEFEVVVYHNRPQTQSVGLVPIGENAYPATFQAPDVVVVPYGGQRPTIKKMGWILDSAPFGYFYRVISVQDSGSSLTLQVQTPFRGRPGGGPGTVVFMDNVAEVFERSTLE
jgi:hypothetical protein